MFYRVTFMISINILWLSRIFVNAENVPFHFCDSVIYPEFKSKQIDNCTLTCGLHFEQHGTWSELKEIALCYEGRQKPFLCSETRDCFSKYPGSYCKRAKCFCEKFDEKHKFLTKPSMSTLDICVIQSTSVQTRAAFPWKTVLAVCGALGVVAFLFVCLRWIYPMIQEFNRGNNRRSDWQESSRENSIYSPTTVRDTTTSFQETNYNQSERVPDDKPPAYETIQLLDVPPQYEDTSLAQNDRQRNQRERT